MCGGASSRIQKEVGLDKSLLPFGIHSSMIEYQADRLSNEFEHVYLSSKTEKIDSIYEYIFDLKEVNGIDTAQLFAPTLCIYSVLSKLNQETLFVPVDMPLIDMNKFVSLSLVSKRNSDAIVLKAGDKIYPTCGVYSPRLLPILADMIVHNRHKMQTFLDEINTQYIEFEPSIEFTNINHYADYERIKSETNAPR